WKALVECRGGALKTSRVPDSVAGPGHVAQRRCLLDYSLLESSGSVPPVASGRGCHLFQSRQTTLAAPSSRSHSSGCVAPTAARCNRPWSGSCVCATTLRFQHGAAIGRDSFLCEYGRCVPPSLCCSGVDALDSP